MSGKLDQSLDEILSTSKRVRTKRGGGRMNGRNGKPTAPAGGIAKNNNRGGRGGAKNVPTGPAAGRKPAGGSNGSKAIISNLVSMKAHSITSRPFTNSFSAQGCKRGPDQGMLSIRLYCLWPLCRKPVASYFPLDPYTKSPFPSRDIYIIVGNIIQTLLHHQLMLFK